MKLFFFSDMHFMSLRPSDFPPYSDRTEYQVAACSWLAEQIRQYNPDVVVNLGDSNTTHSTVSMEALSAFGCGMEKVLHACIDIGTKFYIVAGNHDLSSKRGIASSFLGGMRAHHPSIKLVVDQPVVFGERDLALIPYCHSEDQFFQMYRPLMDCRVVGIHQDLKSALWSPGRGAEVGLDMGALAGPKQIVAGHYHHPQRFQSKSLAIVGSPFYTGWSDSLMSRPRGALFVDGEKLSWLCNPHTPLRHTVKADSTEDVESWLAEIRQSRWFKEMDFARLHLRLVCPSESVFAACAERVLQSGPVLSLVKRVREAEQEVVRVDSVLALDEPVEAVRAYVAASSVAGEIDEALVGLAMEALRGS